MHVCSASLPRTSLVYRESKTHLLVSSHAPDLGPASAPLLKHLHWLPVSARIHFKIALLTFKSLHTIAPSYLSSLILSLCSFARPPLFQCSAVFVSHMSAPFSALGVLGRLVQQSGIPYHSQLLPAPTIQTFKKQLKTHLFASAFPSSWIVLNAPLIRWSPLIYLSGCLWFCACLNVCYYYYYYYFMESITEESCNVELISFMWYIH